MEYKAKILWGMSLSDIDTEMGEIAKAEYEGKAVDKPHMWDLLETKKRYIAARAKLDNRQNKDNEITIEDIYNQIKNEEEETMSNTFKSITGIEYTCNDLQTRFYTIDAEGKKTRISRKAYEEAKADHEAEQAKAWEAEAEAERKAREDKIAADAKATEDAVNDIVAVVTKKTKKTEKKPDKKDQPKAETKKIRKSKDIAHEHKDGDLTITLTAKQVDFVLHLSDSAFWEKGLDSVLWCDVLCDEIKGQFEGKPMTIGAMVSTLCEKGLATRTKDRITDMTTGKSRKSTTFQLTEKGKEIAKELGLH